MAEKDIMEKTLEAYNDVFADIVNVLLFNGEEIINENDLIDETTTSYYKISDKIKGQDRDVSKIWMDNVIHLSSFGFENETRIERSMPIRVIGYDGASYRNQLTNENKKKLEFNYPVVTLVLYFGMERWNKNLSLVDCLNIPEKLKPFVSDYKINVFEIAYLSDEQVKMFKSDFRLVADYFVQIRKTGKYCPMPDNIVHIWEMLSLMSVLTDDDRFEKVYHSLNRKEPVNMCKVIDDYIEQGIERGIEQGIERGIERGIAKGTENTTILSIKNIMKNLGLTVEQALNVLEISDNEKGKYLELLKV